MPEMLQTVRQTIQDHGLIQPGDCLVVAVSGGADSVAMLYALHYFSEEYTCRLVVAHLEHGIRAAASLRDAAFVRSLGWKLGLPVVMEQANVPEEAQKQSISIEMAAREARMDFLERLAEEQSAAAVAVGHTHDDAAETFLIRLMRGAGTEGLGVLPYENTVGALRLVRPLRDVSHDDTLSFLRCHRLPWREDETNRDPTYMRNRVRHELLPLMKRRLNPRIREALVRTATILRDEHLWMQELADSMLEECRDREECEQLDVVRLKAFPVAAQRRILTKWLNERGVDLAAFTYQAMARIEELIASAHGTQWIPLGSGYSVVRRYDKLDVRHGGRQRFVQYAAPLPVDDELVIPEAKLLVKTTWTRGIVKQRDGKPGLWPAEASLNADRVEENALYVRSQRPGDRVRPPGMRGSKKLQDILVDQKVPRDVRRLVPVIVANEEIVWFPGYCVARGWEVPSQSARSLHLRIEPFC